jgi:putative polyketide hydroxylase
MSIEPVVISGAGPAGLALALSLARLGVPATLYERRSAPSQHPRAHVMSTRTMELFRLWGIEEPVRAQAFPAKNVQWEMLAMIGGISPEDRDIISTGRISSCAQDLVEIEMRKALEQYPDTKIHWGHTITDFTDHGTHVDLTISDGSKTTQQKARFLIAAEGSKSDIREKLEIKMLGNHHVGSVMNIYFYGRIKPEGENATIGGRSMDPDLNGAFISMDGNTRYTFQLNYDPEVQKPEDFNFENCEEYIRRAAGITDDRPIEVKNIRPWKMTAHAAEKMVQGNIFLIGDAAHAFPPTGGFGANSGIQDAHNLAWKLAEYLAGRGTENLLESFDKERVPVAFLNTAQSFRNERTFDLRGTLAKETDEDRALYKRELAFMDSKATKTVRSTAADAKDDNERGQIEMLEHFSAIGQDVGYGYDESNVIVYGPEKPRAQAISRYVPEAAPGCRAPHVWLTAKDGSKTSTLNLSDGCFALMTAEGGLAWVEASNVHNADKGNLPEISAYRFGEDADYTPDRDFKALYEIEADGCVIVRPDGYVVYRSKSSEADALGELRKALAVAVGQ